jgi:hypothetical protein
MPLPAVTQNYASAANLESVLAFLSTQRQDLVSGCALEDRGSLHTRMQAALAAHHPQLLAEAQAKLQARCAARAARAVCAVTRRNVRPRAHAVGAQAEEGGGGGAPGQPVCHAGSDRGCWGGTPSVHLWVQLWALIEALIMECSPCMRAHLQGTPTGAANTLATCARPVALCLPGSAWPLAHLHCVMADVTHPGQAEASGHVVVPLVPSEAEAALGQAPGHTPSCTNQGR